MAADSLAPEQSGARPGWRSATWPRPAVVVAMVSLGLGCSVVMYLLGSSLVEIPDDVRGAGEIVDGLAVAAMLPFVLLALPRRLPNVDGEPVGRPLARTLVFAGTTWSVWFGLVAAVGHGEVRYAPTGLRLALPIIVITILQVTAEESLFRLLLPLTLVRLFGRSPHAAIAATGVSVLLFGLFHFPSTPAAFADHVLFGLLMHQALSATRMIRVPIILHALNNVFAQSFVLDATAAPETTPQLLAAKYLIFFAVAAVLFPVRPAWPTASWTQRFATAYPASAGVSRSGRLAAVDALRGVATLAIMLENLLIYLPSEFGSAATSPADRGIRAIMAALLEYRGLPLFALLLGFGVHMLARRASTAEEGATVIRRSFSFIVIGTLHGLIVFPGDILAVYGLLLYVLVWAVRKPQRVRIVTWISGVLFALQTLVLPFTLTETVDSAEPTGSMFAPTVAEAFTERMTEWLSYVLSTPLLSSGLLFPMLIGFRTAALVEGRTPTVERVRIVRLLSIVLGLGSVVMCLPYAVVLWTSWGDVDDVAGHPWELVSAQLGGLAGALAGWSALVAIRSRPLACVRTGRILAVIGTRSLTLYLLHSVAFAVLLTPPLGGLATVVPYPLLAGAVILAWVGAGLVLSRCSATRAGLAERLVRDMAAYVPVDHLRTPASRTSASSRQST